PALAQGAGAVRSASAVVAKSQALTSVVAKAALLPSKAPVPAPSVSALPNQASDKATRQEMQALVQCLQQIKPSDRPVHREVLLALLQAQLGSSSTSSPRVAH